MSDIRGLGGSVFIDEVAFHEARTLPSRKCRVCSCSDTSACMTEDGPCFWLEEDLCSAHIDEEDGDV